MMLRDGRNHPPLHYVSYLYCCDESGKAKEQNDEKGRKRMKKRLMILCTLVLALAFCFGATAEEPHGDGNGIVSRPLLASMYKWLGDASSF